MKYTYILIFIMISVLGARDLSFALGPQNPRTGPVGRLLEQSQSQYQSQIQSPTRIPFHYSSFQLHHRNATALVLALVIVQVTPTKTGEETRFATKY
jgi:hypothetical protein